MGQVDFHGAGRDDHALADLAVGQAGSNVTYNFYLGSGKAVPALGGTLALTPGPADIGNRLLQAQRGALGMTAVIAVVSPRVLDSALKASPKLRLGRHTNHAQVLTTGRGGAQQSGSLLKAFLRGSDSREDVEAFPAKFHSFGQA
jgi:hypothetical protein